MDKGGDRFIRVSEVIRKTGMSRATIYRKMKIGEFPLSIPLSVNQVVWLESEIEQWMEDKINNRNNKNK